MFDKHLFLCYKYSMKKSEEKLTKIYNYLNSYIKNNGYPPSYREISSATDVKSTNSVKKYIDKLEEKGMIKKESTKNRCIKIISEEIESNLFSNTISIPLVGQVTAGIPILAQENITDNIVISRSFFGTSDTVFMLKVSGDSMIDADIHDGDYIVVKQQSTAENGDIVVAMLDGFATVKSFYKEKDCIRLQPQNIAYEPIRSKEIVILGLVIGLIRKF